LSNDYEFVLRKKNDNNEYEITYANIELSNLSSSGGDCSCPKKVFEPVFDGNTVIEVGVGIMPFGRRFSYYES
jgi:hypothetical protein